MKPLRYWAAGLGVVLLASLGQVQAQGYYEPNTRRPVQPEPVQGEPIRRPADPGPAFDYSTSFFNRYVSFGITANYGVMLPMGSQTNYIDRISPANFVIQGEWLFPARFSLGLKSGYQYNQNRLPRQTVEFAGGEIVSAVQTRTLTTIPVMATAAYYFADNAAALRPYVMLAGGGAFVDYSNFYGSLVDRSSGFRGAVAPAVGVKLFGGREKGFGGQLQAEYQNVFFRYNEINNAQNLLISAGITYRWY